VTESLLEVGRIGRAHGVRGDVYVSLLTDRPERLAPGARLQAGSRWLVVTSATAAGERWRVHFEGVDDRTAAEALVNTALRAEPLPAQPDDDALWVADLIGSRVVDAGGVERGTCVAVVANPASDLLELDTGALVPVVFVTACAGGVTTIDPPDGLFDLDE
jgi:16S rRNA processing protein RimM